MLHLYRHKKLNLYEEHYLYFEPNNEKQCHRIFSIPLETSPNYVGSNENKSFLRLYVHAIFYIKGFSISGFIFIYKQNARFCEKSFDFYFIQ